MCDPLAVDQQDVGLDLERLVGLDDRRRLAKREQAWDVRKAYVHGDARPFHDFSGSRDADDHRGVEPLAAQVVRDVGPGDHLHLGERSGHVDLAGKLFLQRASLPRVEIPGVQRRDSGHDQSSFPNSGLLSTPA
jgi:hypothetical protein